MPANSNMISGFGIRRVWIATPAASPTWNEIPNVTQASFKAAVQEVEQTGNDTIVDTWYFGQKGTIAVKGTRGSLSVFAALSGIANQSTSSYSSISFGRNEELTPPNLAVRGLVIGKDDNLAKVYMIPYWYKTHVKTAFESFPDGQYGKLQEVTMNFTAYKSSQDETATAITVQALGRVEVWDAATAPAFAKAE